MDFNLTTFALEILNFLILIWLLKRFFYQPILAVIEKRQATTAQIVTDAKNTQQEAEALKSLYETHLSKLDKEYAIAKARVDEEIAVERTRRLVSLEADIAMERTRREAMESRERSEFEQALERKAIQLAERFATRLLERFAGPELNTKLAELAINELEALPSNKQEALHAALHDTGSSIKVVSAYPLDEPQRASFAHALSQLAGRSLVPEFSEESLLKAGVCIMTGSWVLMANLRDELSFFNGNLEHES